MFAYKVNCAKDSKQSWLRIKYSKERNFPSTTSTKNSVFLSIKQENETIICVYNTISPIMALTATPWLKLA